MRKSLLLSVASLAIISAPVEAASILYASSGSDALEQSVSDGGVTQIEMENGAVVSIVGPAQFSLQGEEIVIQNGGITVAGSADMPVSIILPGTASAIVAGSGSLTIGDGQITGNVMDGQMAVTTGRTLRRYSAGQNWWARQGANASRVLANSPQPSPSGAGQAVIATAQTGRPVTLGNALQSVGAAGDVIAASHNLEIALANPTLVTLPSGDIATLIGFSDQLAAALGGAGLAGSSLAGSSFEGASPALINAYLQFLANDGQIGAFQSAYASLVSQYLALLANGGFAGEFEGADLTGLNAYVVYLQNTGGLSQIANGQQDLIAAYLQFLSGGGTPSQFVAPANLLNQDAIAAYVGAINAYANFLAAGGNPAEFGTSADIIQAYLESIARSGLLDQLFGAQANALTAYLEFLDNGGAPGDFTGFEPGTTPVLTDELAAQYVSAIQAYIAFLQGGGAPADFAGGANVISTYLLALQNAGVFSDLLGAQAATLQAYLDFLDNGGTPADFDFGLSDQLAQQYVTAIQAYLDFINAGGLPSEFAGLPSSVFQAYLEALSNAGLFETLLSDQADFLDAYLAFLQGGGAIDDFDLLPDAPSSAEQLASVRAFLTFVENGGIPSEFDGESIATLTAFFDNSDVVVGIGNDSLERRLFASEYFYFAGTGADPDAFPALKANGGDTLTVQSAYSYAVPGGAATFGAGGGREVLVDANGVPFNNLFNGIPLNGSVLQPGNDVVQSEYDTNGDITVSRLTNIRKFYSGQPFDIDANMGAHYAFVPVLPALPGDVTIDYGLTYATSPTFVDGSSAPGTFAADIRLQFGADGQTRLATTGSITMPQDATYQFTTAGGLDGVGDLPVTTFVGSSGSPLIQQSNIALTGTGKACVSGASCTLYMAALPGGQNAQYLGVSYDTRNGGENAVAIQGAAAFTAQTGGGGGGGDGAGSGPFALENVSAIISVPQASATSFFVSNGSSISGPATRREDGAFTSLSDNVVASINAVFDLGTASLISQFGTENALITRYGEGTLTTFGTESTLAQGQSAFLATISDPALFLPVSGTATYQLIESSPVVAVDGSLAEGTFDASLAIAFGVAPRFAIEGAIEMDATYTFATNGGLAGVATSGTQITRPALFSVSTLIGEGALCPAGASCSLRFLGQLADDFATIASTFYTNSGGAGTDVLGGAIFGSSDLAGLETGVETGTASGTLSANFAAANGILSFVDTGGSNRRQQATSSAAFVPLETDARGLVRATQLGASVDDVRTIIGRGNLVTEDLAGNQDWQVGRFVGGSIESDINRFGSLYGPDSGFAYALIPILENLPATGRIDYTLLGATQPTYQDGSSAPGTFAGAMSVALGSSPMLGVEATITMSDASYGFVSDGGLADPSILGSSSGNFFGNLPVTVSGSGTACASSANCRTYFSTRLGGEAGAYATMAYDILELDSNAPQLSGTAVFGGTYDAGSSVTPPDGTQVADQIVMYSSTTIGIDSRENSTVTYDDATGAPLAYVWETNTVESPSIGSNQQNDSGSVAGLLGWTRWSGGTTSGQYFNDTDGIELPTNGGWHIVAGQAATNLPTSGTVQYALLDSTAPTIRDGSLAPGTFSGDLAVAFGSAPRVGVEFDISIGGSDYAINTPGGIADPMAGGMALDTDNMRFFTRFDEPVSVQGNGPACAGSGECNVIINGFLSGDGASHAGVVYTFGNAGFDTQIDGSAVFAAP